MLGLTIWAAVATLFLGILSLPVSPEAQFVLGLTAVSGMIIIRSAGLGGIWRQIFFALGTAVIIRYFFWRVSSTLPPADDIINFAPAILLLGAEFFAISMLAMSLFVIADPIARKRVQPVSPEEAPTVDVFVPSYNEDVSLLGVTLAAARSMRYPADKLTVYLLDDGGTDEKVSSKDPAKARAAMERRAQLQNLCSQLGVVYMTRQRNERAKAGNLNNALAHTSGELVLVLDADHAPAAELLDETIAHFLEDPKLFLVQTPHFFLNPDPIERNLRTFEHMPSENEMFYGKIQQGLDKWNASFFCGSAAVLRRRALLEAGGFSGESITEDAETALELHAKGWNSRYIDRPMIAGLQPETFEAFIGQRSRWCSGMIQILLLKRPPFRSGLTFAQRISYLSNSLFWLFPIGRLIFMTSPLLFIFFDMKIFVASTSEFFAYTVLYLVASLLMQSFNYSRVRWPWVSELYEYVQSIYLVRSIVGVIASPRSPKFNVTQKGVSLDKSFLSHLALPYFVVFLILTAAMGVVIVRYAQEPALRDLLMIIGAWNFFNLVIAGAGLGVVSEERERRRSQRVLSPRAASLTLEGVRYPVQLENVSFGGIAFSPIGDAFPPPSGLPEASLDVVSLDGAKTHSIRVRICQNPAPGHASAYGAEFIEETPERFMLIADLIYSDMTVLRDIREQRRVHRGILLSTGRFIVWGFRYAMKGIYFAIYMRNRASNA